MTILTLSSLPTVSCDGVFRGSQSLGNENLKFIRAILERSLTRMNCYWSHGVDEARQRG